ncbi:ACT domain protein [Orientia tsutsugamushi str. UT76]|nr:ACT domain protein [Orientia tsutsugamushi str. UT76]
MQLSVRNKIGSLASITTILENNNVNICNIKTTNCTQSTTQIIIDIEISTLEQLNKIINILQSSQDIISVKRVST